VRCLVSVARDGSYHWFRQVVYDREVEAKVTKIVDSTRSRSSARFDADPNRPARYFDCKRRLQELHDFRRLGATYFNHTQFSRDAWMGSGPTEDEEAKRARPLLDIMPNLNGIVKMQQQAVVAAKFVERPYPESNRTRESLS
jgi:hypothetical protein